jgi:probable rRNA maturation factor
VSQLEIIVETRVPKGLRSRLRKIMNALMRHKQVSSGVCVVLSDDAKLRELKKTHWGEDTATDVLTFPQWEPGDPFVPETLGDIIISLETAERQAQERGHSLETEVIVLASHGLTHLLGFDHQTEAQWAPFHDMERLALEQLGSTPRVKSAQIYSSQ